MQSTSLTVNPLFIVGASFILTASLAWNDAIQAAINNYYKFSRSGVAAKLAYAICVTLIVVTMMYFLNYVYSTVQGTSAAAANCVSTTNDPAETLWFDY